MRKEFAAWLEAYGAREERVVVLTGDLGFQALEGVRARLGHRFVNAGVAEQNMVSMAAGLASEGLRPFCYSIAPFAVFRPAEQIRLDVCVHDLDVKIVGNGGGLTSLSSATSRTGMMPARMMTDRRVVDLLRTAPATRE